MQDLKDRTKQFSLAIIDLIEELPNTISGRTIANQLVRSGTSVGANYRASCRSRSDKEFVSKMNIVLEEADELTAIFVSTLKTMNKKHNS